MRRSIAVSLMAASAVIVTACGSRTAVPRPFPTAGPPAPHRPALPDEAAPVMPAPAASAEVQSVVQTAVSLLGVPYRNGGNDARGFDCSGFVTYVFSRHGVALPRTVEGQSASGEDVARPSAGDLVFFATSGRGPTHVGIALGPDRFIHAPSSHGVVRIEMLGSPYWSQRFVEARRVLRP